MQNSQNAPVVFLTWRCLPAAGKEQASTACLFCEDNMLKNLQLECHFEKDSYWQNLDYSTVVIYVELNKSLYYSIKEMDASSSTTH